MFLGVFRHLKEQDWGDQFGFLMRLWASHSSVPSCSLPDHTGDCLAPGLHLFLVEHYDAQQGSDFLQELP